MTPEELLAHATEFTFPVVPQDHYLQAFIDIDMYTIVLSFRGPDSWAVLRRGSSYCWNRRTKGWDYEPSPSSRTDAFKRTHRFTLAEALAIVPGAVAKELAIQENRWPGDGGSFSLMSTDAGVNMNATLVDLRAEQ
jgi:hypothetical protein